MANRMLHALMALVLVAVLLPAPALALPPSMPLAVSPFIESISPFAFAAGVNTRVTITGASLGATVTATLGTTELWNVQAISQDRVLALVPWSIAPGTYDLTVWNSSGAPAYLLAAVTVTPEPAGWTSGGPFGGNLWDVVMSPAVSTTLLVSAQRSGVFTTSTGAAAWAMSLVAPFPTRVQFGTASGGQPEPLYVGGDGGLGLMRSLNNGLGWLQRAPQAFHDGQATHGIVTRAFVRPGATDEVYVGLSSSETVDPYVGLYRSPDKGETWSVVITDNVQVTAMAFDPMAPATGLVIGTNSGQVYTSTNNGASWSGPVSVGSAGFIGRLVFAPIVFSGHRALWAIAGDSQSGGDDRAYRSYNGGATWTAFQPQAGSNVSNVAYHPTLPGVLWAAAGGGYFSEEDGDNWQAVGPGLGEVNGFAVAPGSGTRPTTTVYAATRGGLYKSTNGGNTWAEADLGLSAVLPRTIAVSPFNADEAYIATSAKGLLHTWDGGRTWGPAGVPMGDYQAAIEYDPTVNGKAYFGYGKNEISPTIRFMNYPGGLVVSRSLTIPAPDQNKQGYISAIAADPATPNRLLAGACVGSTFVSVGSGYIYASADGGINWTAKTVPAGAKCILRLTFHPSDPSVVYAGTNGTGLLRSGDGGATWAYSAGQPAGTEIGAIAADPRDPLALYVMSYDFTDLSNDVGVFVSHNGGATWAKMTGLLEYPVWELKLVRFGVAHRLVAATMNGLRYLTVPEASPGDAWTPATGIAATATIDGYNAGVEPGRVVQYIGTSGGTAPTALAGTRAAGPAVIAATIPGGVYRSMSRVFSIYLPLTVRSWSSP